MRKTFVAAAVAAILSAGAFLTSANAMTLAAPAGARAAANDLKATEQVRYVCYRVKRNGVWRKICKWRPNYAYSYGYPGYYYGYRPYYRSYPYYGYYGYGYRRPGIYLRF